MQKEEEAGGGSKIFIIICLFSYWPRQNIRGIEGSISKKKFLRKKQHCRQGVGRPCLGHYDFHYMYNVCMYVYIYVCV